MKRYLLRPIVLLCVLAAGCATQPTQPSNILLGPYVTAVSETSARVLWVTEPNAGPIEFRAMAHSCLVPLIKFRPVKAEVAAGPLPGRPEVLHSAVLTGLKGGDVVNYTIKDSKGSTAGSFQTARPPEALGSFRFLVYGDTRSFPERHRAVAEAARRDGPYVFNINTGDMVASGLAWNLWKKEFFDPAKELLASATIWPVRGNHEADAVMYGGLFPGLPNSGLYYSFDCGNAHFAVLDSGDEDVPPDPAMLAWLEKDLSASKAQWKFAVYHKPTVDTVLGGKVWGRRDVWPLLQKYGVDMILSGHSHVYERFRPIGEKGAKPIIQIVTGGGGAPTYECKPSPALEVGYDGLNYCILEIAGPQLRLTAKSPDGNVIDRVQITKGEGGLFDKATMDRALTAPEAWEIAYVLTGFWADFVERPVVGKPAVIAIPTMFFPKGATVEIAPLTDNPWGLQTTRWEVGDEPLQLPVVPPANLGLTRSGGLRPTIHLKLSVTYQGKTYTREDCYISTSPKTVGMLTPEPTPVLIPRAKGEIAVDGDLKDWADIPFLTPPSTRAASKITRLAWRPEGIYGALLVPDANVRVNPAAAWKGDCLELFLDANRGRAADARKDPACTMAEIYPLPQAGEGKGGSRITHARPQLQGRTDVIPVAWKRTAGGYALEFFIPAEAIAPARMEKGTRVGFQYVLDDDGAALERFVRPDAAGPIWQTSLHWGVIELGE
jgi:hypothetical protein